MTLFIAYFRNKLILHLRLPTADGTFALSPMVSVGGETSESVVKPYAELSNSEATVALAWMPSSPSCIVTGTGVKWLRIYDLRGGKKYNSSSSSYISFNNQET